MYNHILLTLDGSAVAETALTPAAELASALSARLTLLSVVEPIVIHSSLGIMGPDLPSVTIDEKEALVNYLQMLCEKLREYNIQVGYIIREGDAASEICDYAVENDVDLIVMSTHGRSGIKRWVYGSVADRVLRGAKVPVLLVRASVSE